MEYNVFYYLYVSLLLIRSPLGRRRKSDAKIIEITN